MKKSRVSIIAAVVLASAGGLAFYRLSDAKEAPAFRYATATRGDIEQSVSSTGTLGAVTTVRVGTQVSGQVAAINVDFNDHVKKGQLLARIDPTLAQQSVRDAEAGVERVKAQAQLAQQEYDRNKTLYDAKVITESEFGSIQSALTVAKANLTSAQVALDKARQNLAFTNIYAPIDGVIVERDVDLGQTVAASLSAPQLFLIANTLTQMQILASVDESDIGSIKEGQPAKFSVQSYANQTFTGTVKQVRLQSTTVNNVVNYTAVIEVQNPDGKLLPGMTATVQFQTGSEKNAILVPNSALRFKGTDAMIAALPKDSMPMRVAGDTSRAQSVAIPNAPQGNRGNGGFGGPGGPPGGGRGLAGRAGGRTPGSMSTVWYVDSAGKPAMARVRTGMTDGQNTVIMSRKITEGTKIIVGLATTTTAATTKSTNPLAPQQQGGGRGGPGGF